MKKFLVAISVVLALTSAADARRHKWCGSYARTSLVSVDPGPDYNVACKWRGWGSPTYAHEGAMVVWCGKHHHHVGKITGPCDGSMCMVTSGNDGGAVKSRMRSVAGAEFRI